MSQDLYRTNSYQSSKHEKSHLHLQENKTYNKKQRLDQILKDKDVHYANAFELWNK